MSGFISSRARVEGYLEPDVVVLGPSTVGYGTLLGKNVMIGYPSEKTIKTILSSHPFRFEEYDAVSKGATVGRECIVRSGSVIYETASLGDKVRVGHNVLIREGSFVDEEALIGSSSILDGSVRVGKRTKIQSNVYLPHLTVIGDDVFISPRVCFTNDPYPPSRRMTGVTVERGAIICANVTIIAGVQIGENSVVGAGAVVTRDVPANTVVLGVPARHYMTREEFDRKRDAWERLINPQTI
ncbi:MAG: DapH/DapD/GlmU-related protein [Nitrososphaerota archaeon]|nr:N-acetyltransferase [Candidatus Bathyarchaeota archaeon]MDW8048897.1 DapH/DapD/GlmU-related protein [Nitrososphaerota archaeon]